MPIVRTFAEANELLRSLYENYSRGVASDFYRLDRMRNLMHQIGNPQDKTKVIHVAGTSGKGSTCYYLASLLTASGASVGLSVSPHIFEINERVQVNMQPLGEEIFCRDLGEFWDIASATGLQPSYFEMLTAFAYWEFARRNLDYAVMEVGVGGLSDGTNVVRRENKVCVITDIGLDHTKLLGNTIPEIAFQKAGIIERRNHVFMYEQGDDVMWVVRKRCEEKRSVLYAIRSEDKLKASGLPLFQQRNLQLAERVIAYVLKRDGRKPLNASMLQIAAKTVIPGRMEVFHINGKTLIIDGAHNEQKMTALVRSIQAAYPGKRVAALVSVLHGLDDRWQRSLGALIPILGSCIVTNFHQNQGDRIKWSAVAEDVGGYLHTTHKVPVRVEPAVAEAFDQLLQAKESVLLVTGSVYVLADILQLVGKRKPEVPREIASVLATGGAARI